MYVHQLKNWPSFTWEAARVGPLLAEVRYAQGYLMGRVSDWGFNPRQEASMETIVTDVITNGKIEGEELPLAQVRSSVARKLGLPKAGLVTVGRDVDGMVEMMLDATQNYRQTLSHERLFNWHASLFPSGRSGLGKIVVGRYRDNTTDDPMQVISGSFGRPKVYFEAVPSAIIEHEMVALINYVNKDQPSDDSIIKAAIVHLWLLTIHPFDDGNGRIARAVTDMMLARADGFNQRFYSMSSAILSARKYYYRTLESSQKGGLDVTEWLLWFLKTLLTALEGSSTVMTNTFAKANFWQRHQDVRLNDRQRVILNKLWDGYAGKLTSSHYAKFTSTSQDTAARDINYLIAHGLLRKGPAGGRSTQYVLIKET
ncbi:Fic family protein [Neolewinella antarctica]|uniref:Fic family protein n=1 Tax=Neolewinella antarctica TaxID=442734 RepID=A0ABX0XBH4_9BACT|nr:Fic family protein [Neolewinella antarctica]NJC26557.1 Fic family protein [Neolewinella antarctica]